MTIAKLGLYVGGAAAAGTGLLFMMSTGGQENKTIQRRMTRMIDPKERDIDLAMQQSQFYKNAKTKAQTPANLR